MTTTVTRLYDTFDQAKSAVNDLEASGISHNDISIIANNANGKVNVERSHLGAGTGAAAGAVAGGAAGLLAGLGLLAIPGIGPVVAAGWLAVTGAGALVGGGAGGLIGSLTDHGVSDEDAEVYAEALRRGGALVAVKADDDEINRVDVILERHSAIDLSERAAGYREAGWTGFDADSTVPYTAAEIEAERARTLSHRV